MGTSLLITSIKTKITQFGSDVEEVKDKFLYQARETPILPHWCSFAWHGSSTRSMNQSKGPPCPSSLLQYRPFKERLDRFLSTSAISFLENTHLDLRWFCKKQLTESVKNVNLLPCSKLCL